MPHRIHTSRLTPPRAHLLTAATLASVTLAATGCGSSSSPTVAHLSAGKGATSASSQNSGSAPESTANPQQALIGFAKCMRSNGLPNFPDPNGSGGFAFHASAEMNPSSPAFKAAQAKCRKLMPGGGPPGPGSRTNPSAQTLARFLSIARCMRQHGVYGFPDPKTSIPSNPFAASGTGVISNIEGVILIFPSTINQQSPTFTRAAATCAFPLHSH
jgi:hypothetical protein